MMFTTISIKLVIVLVRRFWMVPGGRCVGGTM
jgi:hypothetical protein